MFVYLKQRPLEKTSLFLILIVCNVYIYRRNLHTLRLRDDQVNEQKISEVHKTLHGMP